MRRWTSTDSRSVRSSGRPSASTFQHEQTLRRDGLLGLVQSRSYIVLLPEDVRAPLLDRVGAMHDELAVDGSVTVRYETTCYRARLR